MAKNKVIVIDKGWKRIIGELGKADESHTDTGFLEGDVRALDEGGKLTLLQAEVAAHQEFGTKNIPSRPFMRLSIDSNKEKIFGFVLKTHRAVVDGSINVRQGLDRIGVFMGSLIKKQIRDLRTPPNAPSTIKRKKSSNPLIDTAQMINGVDHKIFLSKNPKKLRAA